MGKRKMIIIASVILTVVVISLGIVKLYQTYALGNYIDASSGDTYDIIINENTSIKVPENSYSNVFYMINNTSPGAVTYGVGYETDTDITVKVFSTSNDPASGIVEENGKKYVKLRIENSSSTFKEVKFSTVLGYSGDDDLIVPNGITLVTEVWSTKGNFATYIKDLYEDATKTTVTNNSITYNYATSESLMNDRLGDSDTDIDGGNVRYYGSAPDNYVYFNCNSYPNTTCERWRIIGVFDGKVKLIRNESIGTYSWDNKNTTTGAENDYGKNDWKTARLMKLLNPSNYYTVDTNDNGNGQSLYYNAQSGNCFSGQNNAITPCNFTSTGLKTNTTRNIISEENWYLERQYSYSSFANGLYNSEISSSQSWNGKVGLLYLSELAYSQSFVGCNIPPENYQYFSDVCSASNNWLIDDKNSAIWLITSGSGYPTYSYVFAAMKSNDVLIYTGSIVDANDTGEVFPTLYLNSKIELVDGTGTYDDPYQISDSLVLDNEVLSTYIISYNANASDANGLPNYQTKLRNQTLTLSSTVPTRDGYTFTGWNTKADGSGTAYQTGASFYENGNITLYAQWNQTIKVTYDANGGSGAPSAQTKKTGESLTLSSTIPTRTGYTFVGWNTSSSGNGTSYTAGGTYSADNSITLYAVWSDTVAPVVSTTLITYQEGFDDWSAGSGSISNGQLNMTTTTSATSGYYMVDGGEWYMTFDAYTETAVSGGDGRGGISAGSYYYDNAYKYYVSSNGYYINGYAQYLPLNTWNNGFNFDGYAGFGSKYLTLEFNTGDSYSQPPTYVRNLKVYGKKMYAPFYLINVTATDGAGVTELKYAYGTQTASYFASGGTDVENNQIRVTSNGQYTIYASDASGNETVKVVTVDRVDTTAPDITNAYIGEMLYIDPDFASGKNSISVYGFGGDYTTITRKQISNIPNSSGYGLEIVDSARTDWNGFGGFTFYTQSAANKEYVVRIIAKIPVGFNIEFGSNSIGQNHSREWLTSTAGTGDWAEYVFLVKCGSSGTFETTNFFYLYNDESGNNVTWYVAYATVFDTTSSSGSNSYIVSVAKDNESGINSYAYTTSNTRPTSWSYTRHNKYVSSVYPIQNNGTYYAWFKNTAGEVSSSQIGASYYYFDLNWNLDDSNYVNSDSSFLAGLKIGGVDKGYVDDYYVKLKEGTTWEIYGVKINGKSYSYSASGTIGSSNSSKTISVYTVTSNHYYKYQNANMTHFDTKYDYVLSGSSFTPYNVTAPTGYYASNNYDYYNESDTVGLGSGTVGSSSFTVSNKRYVHIYYYPNSYTLTLTKGTGVSTIYYKVNGASSYSSSSNSTSLSVYYGTTYYYYGTSGGEYQMNSCTASSPCSGTMGVSSTSATLSARDVVAPSISASLYSNGSLLSTSSSSTLEYSGWLKNQVTIVFTASDGGSGVNTSITEYYGKSNSSYPSASSLSSSSNTISSNNTYTKNITVDGYIHTGIRVCDNSSNCSTFYVKFKLDSTPPSATLSAYYTNGGGNVSFTSSGNTFRNDTWLNKVITLELTPSDNVSGVSSSTTFSWNRESIPSTITDSSTIKTISGSETLSLSSGKFTRGIYSPGQRYVTYNLCDNAGNCVTKEVYFKLDTDVPTLTYEGSSSSDSNTKLFACSSLSGTEEFRSSDSAGGTTKRTSPNSGNYYTHWWSSNSNQLYVTCESNAKNQSRYELVRSSSSGTCTYTNQSMDLVTNRTICITNTDTTCSGSQKTYTDCTYNYSTGKIDYKHWYWKSGSSSVTFNKLGTCIGCVD